MLSQHLDCGFGSLFPDVTAVPLAILQGHDQDVALFALLVTESIFDGIFNGLFMSSLEESLCHLLY